MRMLVTDMADQFPAGCEVSVAVHTPETCQKSFDVSSNFYWNITEIFFLYKDYTSKIKTTGPRYGLLIIKTLFRQVFLRHCKISDKNNDQKRNG